MEICQTCNQPIKEKRPVGRPVQTNYEQIVNLRRKGLTLKQISEEVKCSERTVKRVVSAMCKPQAGDMSGEIELERITVNNDLIYLDKSGVKIVSVSELKQKYPK